ncbi:hypothetical protein ACHAXT_002354 [Thalassiosira profunda]
MASSTEDDEASGAIADIEELHRQAILRKQSTYIDPPTGFTVFTELSHLKRGKCCGNQCRHCPYGWSNVRNEAGGFNANDGGRAISGDREMTGRLVKRIMNGTYYDGDVPSGGNATTQAATEKVAAPCSTNDDPQPAQSKQSTRGTTKGMGRGGSTGGALTSKNVPYTRKGDAGTSQLFTGERRNKDDVLFEALGTVDELCSIAGVVYAELNAATEKAQIGAPSEGTSGVYGDLPGQLLDVMSRLFDVGSHIAKPVPQSQRDDASNGGKHGFNSQHTELLEEWIDLMTEQLPELTSFILPTGSPASAQLHVARTVCRRAERRMVPLVQGEGTVDPAALAYVNRLSDYFFTAARYVNFCEDRDEVQYRTEAKGSRRKDSQRERVVVKLKK